MHEKKRPEKILPVPEIKPFVTEVLVANGRSFEPFIRTFSYTGENITRSSLGTLIGVFEIDDQNEDSAYVVNFLASVAKKEYFSNPRRGAIESFEASLHKINLALAELVKHGNITWLGKLHGALGVLEKNNLHFSVTGHAKILLLRNDSLADISEGLASEESHLHPIKTFVEVSSGRLTLLDQIIFCSPELLALFSLDDLSKTAARMDHSRFTQFLKTALVNELDMAGLVVIDIQAEELPGETTPPPKEKTVEPLRVNNVFSQSAFVEKKPSEEPSILEALVEKEVDYIDTKTGHIYIQGETPEAPSQHPFLEECRLALEERLRTLPSILSTQGKWIRKGKKQLIVAGVALGEQGKTWSKKMGRALRRQWRKRIIALQEKREAALRTKEVPTPITPTTLPKHEAVLIDEEKTLPKRVTKDIPLTTSPAQNKENETGIEALPDFMKEKLALFYQRQQKTSSPLPQNVSRDTSATSYPHLSEQTLPILQKTSSHVRTFLTTLPLDQFMKNTQATIVSVRTLLKQWYKHFRSLPLRYQQGLSLVIVLSFAVLFFIMFFSPSLTPQNETPPPVSETTSPTDTTENTSRDTSSSTILSSVSGTIITSVILNDETYLITETSIISINERRTYPLPSGTTARFASAMDDLSLIFITTKSGQMYAFSPISKTFTPSTLRLESNTRIESIGAYLTYLYVLDSANNQIYRFPRAPGGFGTSTPWFKESITIEEGAHMAVNETLFLAADSGALAGYFRGHKTISFEMPPNGLEITDLYSHPGLTNVYALDQKHQSIFIWNQEGKLISTINSSTLSRAATLSVSEKQNEIFVSTNDSLLSFQLP